jgi:C1A family cysteine protease
MQTPKKNQWNSGTNQDVCDDIDVCSFIKSRRHVKQLIQENIRIILFLLTHGGKHLSPVDDQKDIEGCFAFDAAYALEVMCSIKKQKKIKISRQDLVNNIPKTKYQKKHGVTPKEL